MPFHILPPGGLEVDTTQGVQAVQAVFEANRTAPEIAIFGHWAAEKAKGRRRHLPLTNEERRQAQVYDLAKASALEVCAG